MHRSRIITDLPYTKAKGIFFIEDNDTVKEKELSVICLDMMFQILETI